MSKKKKYYDLAEERALTIPVVMWRFCAYKTEKDYESGEHYFVKDFLDHTEMKVFSGEHSAKEKPLHPDYCSMYWKVERLLLSVCSKKALCLTNECMASKPRTKL